MNDSRNNEILVHRILSGHYIFDHQDNIYELRKPSLALKMRADLLYVTTYEDNLYNNFWFLEDTEHFLFELNILHYNYKSDLSRVEKLLDKTKISLFQQYFDNVKRKKIQSQIKNLKQDIQETYNKKHSLDYLTLEHYCDNIRNEYIISNTLYFHDSNELVFKKEPVLYNLFNDIVSYISKNIIDITTYKKIARSDYWRNYWGNNKSNILDEPVKEWSEEQKRLINISCMYDKIYEHPDCPKDDIIEDDDALDGWMLYQKQENQKQKQEKGVDSMLTGKMKNASEVFFMAGSKEQADDVLGLNSEKSLSSIKQKVDFVLSSDKPVSDGQLPDVKAKIIQQLKDKG